MISKAELDFRHYIEPRMRSEWMMTWHEDRGISPGVPDLHYVPKSDGEHRVGWLELKAIGVMIGSNANARIKVEPSQHQYIRRWGPHMPIHFMIRMVDWVYLVPGKYHVELAAARSLPDLLILSDLRFQQKEIAEKLPPFLRKVTAI